MIVYTVEEEAEADWAVYTTEIIGVYESKSKALAKVKEMGELHKYNYYYITTYDTETGGIINDSICS